MTNREIKKHKKKLYSIGNLTDKIARKQQIIALAKKIEAPLLGVDNVSQSIAYATRSIHMVLQTETMLSACGSAKWSCFWAAIAATVACISVVLTYVKI